MMEYAEHAIERSKQGAIDWLEGSADGYPRSWQQEAADDKRRGYAMYEPDWEAPPIAGYEALEKAGIVTRVGTAIRADGQERVHFRRIADCLVEQSAPD